MSQFISAIYDASTLTVDYINNDGSHLLRSGGTIAWRFNNPGNIRPAPTNAKTRIGIGKTKSGAFAIFPSYEVGKQEKRALLRRKYNKYTIPQAMEIYAPRSENDTDAYTAHILKRTGLPKDKPLSDFSDEQLDSMMSSMEEREGFHHRKETRKEKWVHTTNLSLSNGARPLVEEEVKIRVAGHVKTTKTNKYGQTPPIAHTKKGEKVEVFLKDLAGAWKKAHDFTMETFSQTFVLFKDQESYRAKTIPAKPIVSSDAQLKPMVYVVQPRDTISGIAKKHKTTIDQIKASNPSLKDINKIYPGQKIALHGAINSNSIFKPQQQKQKTTLKTVNTSAIKVPVQRSKEGKGEGLALIDPEQKRAPWMEVAIREAQQWAGKKEADITKTDNYHKMSGIFKSKTLTNTPWCASFVSYCLMAAGYPYESINGASSQFPVASKKFIKVDKPVYGAIMVWKKGSQGHIALCYGVDAHSGEAIALGGNQNDSINFMLKTGTTKKFVGYYIPATYKMYYELDSLNQMEKYSIKELNRLLQTQTTSITKDR